MWRHLPALLLLAGTTGAATPPPPDHASAAISKPFPRAALPPAKGPSGAPLIVLDAGHGGRDPGSTGSDGTREKSVTLALALAARAALLEHGHVRVVLTRDADRSVALADRRDIARLLDAALLLSIHCDSTGDGRVHGASIYTLTGAAPDPSAQPAAREFSPDRRVIARSTPGASSLATILTGLAQRETQADADAFAVDLGRALAPLRILKSDFRHAAALRVLRAPDVPSVLLEAGYLSNRADLRRLTTPRARRSLATAIASAVDLYLAQRR